MALPYVTEKIALPLHDLENALLRDNRGIVIIRQIVNTHECSFAGNTLLIILWMSRDNLPVCEIDISKDIVSQTLVALNDPSHFGFAARPVCIGPHDFDLATSRFGKRLKK